MMTTAIVPITDAVADMIHSAAPSMKHHAAMIDGLEMY